MVDTVPAPGAASAPLPDRSVVPPVWGRITNLVVDHGEGSWLVTPEGDRYLDYTSGIGVTNTGHAHPRVVAAIQAQAAKLLHGQQNIVYHEPGLRLYERLAGLLPNGPWSAFLANSGAEAVEAAVKLARVATGRPAIIAFRYGFHGRTAQAMALTAAKDVVPRRVRAAPRVRLPRGLPVLLPRGRRSPRPVRVHVRLGGAARPAVPPARVPGQGRGDHRGAGHRRGRLPRAAARRSCPGSGRSPASTGSCSSPTRSRRASAGPASCSRCATGTSIPTSSSWPRGSPRACRCPGSWRRRELMDAPAARVPRRHVRRQRGLVRGGARDARRHRGRGAGRQRARARRAAARRPAPARVEPPVDRRRPRPRAHGRAGVRPARRGRRPHAGSRRSRSASRRPASIAACSS